MCSASYPNWVTFDDDYGFQSPEGSFESDNGNHHGFKSNGLVLSLSSQHDTSRRSASESSTPLSSPFTSFPCTPKSGLQTPITPSPSRDNYFFKIEELSQTNQFRSHNNENGYTNPFWNQRCISWTGASHREQESNQASNTSAANATNIFFHGNHPPKEARGHHKSQSNSPLIVLCQKLEKIQAEDFQPSQSTNTECKESKQLNVHMSPSIVRNLFRLECKDGWPLMMRIPEKKNMMSSRQWGPIYLKLLAGGILQLYYEQGLEKPFKELQLQPYCRLSEPKLENYKESGKIHTVKIEHVSYTEKRKYHPKTEVLHEAEIEQMLKLGTTDYRDFTDFIAAVEEELMKLPPHTHRRKNYEEQEITLEITDLFWGKFTREGKLFEASVVTHIHCLCFVNGNVECFLTLNDLLLQSRDRSYLKNDMDSTWIQICDYRVHKCVKENEFEKCRVIKFTPPDACRLELMRFKTVCDNPELPFLLKGLVTVHGAYTELQAFLVMSSAFSNLQNTLPFKHCENVMIRFPVPMAWFKIFRTVNLFRQKSLKAKMNRNARLGSVSTTGGEPVMQVTIGTAKYEHAFRAIVWRIDRLPDKNAASDHPHCFSCKLELGSDQEIPSEWQPFVAVEFEVPDTSASKAKVKSFGTESDIQPEKHIHLKARYHYQPRLYKSVIEDVINNVQDFFLEEGIDDHILKDLKQLWESKLLQSRAVEGFFRENNHQQIMLELQQQKAHQTVHTSSASIVIPAGRSVQNFTSAELNTSGTTTTLALPSGISLPIQVPAGVTLQTASGKYLVFLTVPISVAVRIMELTTQKKAIQPIVVLLLLSAVILSPSPVSVSFLIFFSNIVDSFQSLSFLGHLYKVNVPVMVTQSAAGQKYFQQPVRHIIHQVNTVTGQTALIQQNSVSGQAHVIQQSSQDQAATLQQSSSGQVSSHQQLLTNQSFDVAGQSILQQPGMSRHVYIQQQGTVKQVVLQHSGMGVQTGPRIVIQSQPVANTGTITQQQIVSTQQQIVSTQPTRLEQAVEEQAGTGQTQHLLIQDSDRVPLAHTLIVQNQASEQNEGTNLSQCVSEQCVVQQFAAQVNETLLMVAATPEEQQIKVESSSIPQLDGTIDTSSDEEIGNMREVEENDILGIIDAEDLKALEGYDEDDSSSADSSSDGLDEQPKEEIIEEDPLNSGDDVSEQEVPDLFDTENVIVCQYDKIHRSKNKWKFYLKDGIMTFNGRDYVFSKAVGDAEW
ncbi:stonin-1-like [Heptranchias perlo]|uniref:stonin-1-like n=1 Tax=Heptranchias perlo TaxID=212740 RepID=UPI0035596977